MGLAVGIEEGDVGELGHPVIARNRKILPCAKRSLPTSMCT
jgi:hypothetical protein